MKNKIGLIGGISYESTLFYYRHINQLINQKLGRTHSAKLVIDSLDNEEVLTLVEDKNYKAVGQILIESANILEKAGASCLLMCCNTVHKLASEVETNIGIPLIHICDVVVEKINERQLHRVGLIGTKFTMNDSFYKSRLEAKSIDVLLPNMEDRDHIHNIIFEELVVGNFNSESKRVLQRVINGLIEKGAQGIVLGCTEIPLIINQEDISVPVFDATSLHAEKAVEFIMNANNSLVTNEPQLFVKN